MTDPDSSDLDGGLDLGGVDLSGVDLGRVWTGVAAEVWRRHPGTVERLAARLLRSPGLARALLTTPSLLLPWLISTVVVFGAGGLINVAGGQPLVWLLTPAIAAIGIAYAYGPGVDPAWELACSMPVSERMVLLVRAVAVFAVNAFLGLLVSALSYGAISYKLAGHSLLGHSLLGHSLIGHSAVATAAAASAEVTVAWLLPMAAVCAVALAVAVITRSAGEGALAGVFAWTATVLSSGVASSDFTAAVTNTATYLPYLAVAACATALIGYMTRNQRGIQ